MNHQKIFLLVIVLCGLNRFSYSQSLFEEANKSAVNPALSINGFVRGGLYSGLEGTDDIYFPTCYADMSLRITAGNGIRYKGFADLRYRYGSEFGEPSDRLWLNEAWAAFYTGWSELSMGKQVIKWGRADMFNPTSLLNPRDDLYRSPDREDRELGNILLRGAIHAGNTVSLEGVFAPVYTPSKLPTQVMDLPSMVNFDIIDPFLSGKDAFSWALRGDLHTRGFDMGVAWFHGYDILPGIRLAGVDIPESGLPGDVVINLEVAPYRTMMAGLDFETSFLGNGFRGEFAWTDPVEEEGSSEHIPFPEVTWVTGVDRSFGDWQLVAEYTGKYIVGHTPASVEPRIPDESMSGMLLSYPPETVLPAIREQIRSFNRLYKYQIERFYHTAGLTFSYSGISKVLRPELAAVYNFTTNELLVIPTLGIKPSDGLTVKIGGEYWNGPANSLYDMIHTPLNSIFLSLKAEF